MIDRRAFVAGTLAFAVARRAKAQPVAAAAGWDIAQTIVDRIQPPTFPAVVFPITSYGAKPNAPAQAAIEAAITACATAGGGRVLVPAGLWRVNGAIHLRSNVELHLERGATLRFGKPGEIDLPIVLTRWEGTEVNNISPLIYARDCQDIAITGDGLLDGQGGAGFRKWRDKQADDKKALREMGATGVPVTDRQFGPDNFLRPAFVQFFNCRNVLIDGPRFVDSPFWTIHPVYSRNITIRNISVVSKHLNSDGVDPDSCEDVLIERCRFDVSDDCIAIKSGRDQDGWRVARPTCNVVIRDCEMSTNVAGAIAIGSEMSGGASNIFAERLHIRRAKQAVYIKGNLNRGGVVEGVWIRDVSVKRSETLIDVTTAYHGGRRGDAPPTYRGFVIERVACAETGQALSITGVPAAPVQDMLLRDVRVGISALPDKIAHTRGFRMEDVRINRR